ncbi:MAG: ABC transporter ATP-binding protein [Lachnospiraceae bacterium]
MAKTMLQIEHLVVDYDHVHAIRDISLHVDKNEIVCLIGSNGAGKTTTLGAISNIVKKNSGQILFEDKDITEIHPASIVKYGISHVPEGRHVFPKMTVGENLILGTMAKKRVTKQYLNDRMEEMYTLFPRLKERVNQAAGTLSGGEQQMLAIARGLMYDPDLIMLDEPSLGLAPIIVEEIFELILRIQKAGKTVLLIEQNANMALQISDRAYLLENGAIVKHGTGSELQCDDSIRKAYLGG